MHVVRSYNFPERTFDHFSRSRQALHLGASNIVNWRAVLCSANTGCIHSFGIRLNANTLSKIYICIHLYKNYICNNWASIKALMQLKWEFKRC